MLVPGEVLFKLSWGGNHLGLLSDFALIRSPRGACFSECRAHGFPRDLQEGICSASQPDRCRAAGSAPTGAGTLAAQRKDYSREECGSLIELLEVRNRSNSRVGYFAARKAKGIDCRRCVFHIAVKRCPALKFSGS